jgi:hypothetical protein
MGADPPNYRIERWDRDRPENNRWKYVWVGDSYNAALEWIGKARRDGDLNRLRIRHIESGMVIIGTDHNRLGAAATRDTCDICGIAKTVRKVLSQKWCDECIAMFPWAHFIRRDGDGEWEQESIQASEEAAKAAAEGWREHNPEDTSGVVKTKENDLRMMVWGKAGQTGRMIHGVGRPASEYAMTKRDIAMLAYDEVSRDFSERRGDPVEPGRYIRYGEYLEHAKAAQDLLEAAQEVEQTLTRYMPTTQYDYQTVTVRRKDLAECREKMSQAIKYYRGEKK